MEYTKLYQPGVPATVEVPQGSLVELFETSVHQAKRKVALDFFGRTTTYATLGDQVARAAEGLRRLGVRAGDRVAVILPNCPQHVVAYFAILRLGAIVVEHNPLYTSRELRHMFESHAARVVIVWDSAVERLREQPGDIELDHIVSVNLLDEMPRLQRLALALPVPPLRKLRAKLHTRAPRTIPWTSLLTHGRLRGNHPTPLATDIATIQYTSGTTGQPKGAILTHRNLYVNALQGRAWMPDLVTGEEVFYGVLPLFHSFGLTIHLGCAILLQARIHLFPAFDVDLVLAAAKRRPPTVLCAVPPIFDALAAAAPKRKVSLKTARFCMSGAMALPMSTVEAWEPLAGGPLIEGYGMTESSPIALGNPVWSTRRLGTIGLPFPSTRIKVTDPDDPTREVAQGERGELLIQGPQVFQGYWQSPLETERALTPDGWLRTGDLVTQDAEGYTTIVDRLKDLIITGGFNVAPAEVEQVLLAYPGIADAAVVGLPHATSGERVTAAVILEPGVKLDVAAIRQFCRRRLAGYKVPRDVIAVETLPKSMLGKVLRSRLRDDLCAQAM